MTARGGHFRPLCPTFHVFLFLQPVAGNVGYGTRLRPARKRFAVKWIALETKTFRLAKSDSTCEECFALKKMTIPTCEEETRFRPARKRVAVQRRALKTTQFRPAKHECFDLRRTICLEEDDGSDLRGRDSIPTCEEENRREERSA